ncbi:hypothetical protein FLAN108750_01345 [Flavobacterium antarcticum]|uniref:hypothetical protein n=1 Tax=Flavobacterium antarcticum TaxID=271155 RepID=UPI0003B5645C|nr:hypothetical protein [Flavobacterium antarcticum]
MKINLKNGIDKLLFGMLQKDVIAIYGKPTKSYKDEEDNEVLLYNKQQMRLTFYVEENLKLGYIVSSNESLTLFDHKLIGKSMDVIKKDLAPKGLVKWDEESFDTYENFFNEDYWMIVQTEFGTAVKVELGAIIEKDEFEWKFKSK